MTGKKKSLHVFIYLFDFFFILFRRDRVKRVALMTVGLIDVNAFVPALSALALPNALFSESFSLMVLGLINKRFIRSSRRITVKNHNLTQFKQDSNCTILIC